MPVGATGKRRRMFLGMLALAFVAGAVWPAPRRVVIPLDVLDRVNAGMEKRDIEELVGGPPGDYRSGPVVEIPNRCAGVYWEDEDTWMVPYVTLPKCEWRTDRAELKMVFLKSGRVAVGSLTEMKREQVGPLDLLLWRIGRWWNSWDRWIPK